MTTSTNALLYYGFTFTEDEEAPPWENEEDEDYSEDEWLCDKLGGPKKPGDGWSEELDEQYSAYWDAQRKFIEELPIKIGYHCSLDYSMYFICAQESYHVAHRGEPEKLGDALVKNLGWDPTIQEYCEKLGIEWRQPQWELASMWS